MTFDSYGRPARKPSSHLVKTLLVFYHDDVECNRGSASEFIRILCRYLSASFDVRLYTYTGRKDFTVVSLDGYEWSRIPRLGLMTTQDSSGDALAGKAMRALAALDPRLSICSLSAPRDSLVLCVDPYAGLLPLLIYKALGHKIFYRPNDSLRSLGQQFLQSGELALGLVALVYGTVSESIISRIADGIFAPSEYVRARFARRTLKNNVKVVPNGMVPIDSSLPEAEAIRRRARNELHLEEENHVFLFIGSGNWKPNQLSIEFLMNQLAPYLTQRDPKARIVIVGQETERYRKRIVAENTIVAGEVDTVSQYIHASDLGLAPLFIFGGLPQKVLTYLQWGLPVLATENARRLVASQRGLHFSSFQDFPEKLLELAAHRVDWNERRLISSITNANYSIQSIGLDLAGVILQSSQGSSGLRPSQPAVSSESTASDCTIARLPVSLA